MSNLFASKKFKYGSTAVVLTAVFVAVIILVNVLLSFVNSKVGLYLDLTNTRLYTLSEESLDALADVEKPIEIIFCQPADKLDDDWYLSKVKLLAQKYADRFDNISISYLDIASDPTAVNAYKQSSATVIPQSSVIISCPDTGIYKIYGKASFFSIGESSGQVFAFNGEYKFTQAFLQVARPQALKALITTGHGETLSSASMLTLLADSGYEYDYIDLATTDIPEDVSLLLICNPSSDFLGLAAEQAGQTNEIAKLHAFITEKFGNIMMFVSPTTPALPELAEFMSDDLGISYTPGAVLHAGDGMAIDRDGYALISSYGGNDQAYAVNLYSELSTLTSSAKAISYYATPLAKNFTENNYTTVGDVLLAPAGTQCLVDGNVASTGAFPTALLSTYCRTIDNTDHLSHTLVFGSPYFADSLFVESEGTSSYANRDIFFSALRLMGNQNATVNIGFKVFDDTSLSVDQVTQKNLTLLLTLVPMGIVLVLAAVVGWKRRRL